MFVRRLDHLQTTASTCRVLNLTRIGAEARLDPDYRRRPLFHSRILNKSIILKHRLRGNELDLFTDHRTIATKIIIPIDRGDLRAGGQFIFLGEKNLDAALQELLGPATSNSMMDRRTLDVMDKLPSFDPFLLREQLRRNGLTPGACYFNISSGDTRRMMSYVQNEIRELANPGSSSDNRMSAHSLATKLMSNEVVAEMEPLRDSLRLARNEFGEGLFAWKGVLYYKWVLSELQSQLPGVEEAIRTIMPADSIDPRARSTLDASRLQIIKAIRQSNAAAASILGKYDFAFGALVNRGQPLVFREFLLEAPKLFMELGETLGVLSHIISFWQFRFRRQAAIGLDELTDIFLDFEMGLTTSPVDVTPVRSTASNPYAIAAAARLAAG